jgi:hypothetical protein
LTPSRYLPFGLYEALVTRDVARVIDELRRAHHVSEEEALDAADAHVALARHVGAVLGRLPGRPAFRH